MIDIHEGETALAKSLHEGIAHSRNIAAIEGYDRIVPVEGRQFRGDRFHSGKKRVALPYAALIGAHDLFSGLPKGETEAEERTECVPVGIIVTHGDELLRSL